MQSLIGGRAPLTNAQQVQIQGLVPGGLIQVAQAVQVGDQFAN